MRSDGRVGQYLRVRTIIHGQPLDVLVFSGDVVVVAVVFGALVVSEGVKAGAARLSVTRSVANAVSRAELAAMLGRRIVALPVTHTQSYGGIQIKLKSNFVAKFTSMWCIGLFIRG